MKTVVSNSRGVALVMTTVMMLMLSLLAILLTSQALTGVKVTGAMKDYEAAFYLADGASQMAIQYLKYHNPPSLNWNPTIQSRAAGLPYYMQTALEITGHNLAPMFRPDIDWKGFDTLPLPGWMLNWQGYSAFHRIHYKAKGEGRLATKGALNEVGALVVKLAK